jgi:uncharacterized protein (TIGR00251 family)
MEPGHSRDRDLPKPTLSPRISLVSLVVFVVNSGGLLASRRRTRYNPVMRIRVRVQPNARLPGVENLADGTLKVRVRAPALDGRANQALTEALADFYQVPRRAVRIIHGGHSRSKLVEVNGR